MGGRTGSRLVVGLAACLLAGSTAAEPTAYATVETLYIDTALGDLLQTSHALGDVELEELGGGTVKLDAVIHRAHTWQVAGGAPLGCTVHSVVDHTYDVVVYLRGGGARYHLRGNMPSIMSPRIFYEADSITYNHSNAGYITRVSPTTTHSLAEFP